MRGKEEYLLCKNVAAYLRLQYPKVLYHFDLAGLNLSRAQAGMMKAIQGYRGYPDLFIADKRDNFSGLFLELKKEGTKIYLKDEITLVADSHIREQAAILELLRQRYFCAEFAIGFNEAKKIIDKYLSI